MVDFILRRKVVELLGIFDSLSLVLPT